MNRYLILTGAVTAIILVIIAYFYFFFRNNPYINTNRAAVIKEMRKLNRLETASFTIEKIIDAGTTQNNALKDFLFGDKILLIAHGEVIAGFDLAAIKDGDVQIVDKALTITLPPPQILISQLDETQTKVYDRRQGLLTKGDRNLESQARSAAQESIREAACQAHILDQASDNARKQLTTLFSAFGFTQVTIQISSGSC